MGSRLDIRPRVQVSPHLCCHHPGKRLCRLSPRQLPAHSQHSRQGDPSNLSRYVTPPWIFHQFPFPRKIRSPYSCPRCSVLRSLLFCLSFPPAAATEPLSACSPLRGAHPGPWPLLLQETLFMSMWSQPQYPRPLSLPETYLKSTRSHLVSTLGCVTPSPTFPYRPQERVSLPF